MFIGDVFIKMSGVPYDSPPFPRGGQGATFAFEILDLAGSPTVTVTVEHKNYEDTSWGSLVTSGYSTVGEKTLSGSAIAEECRCKVEFAAGDDADDAARIYFGAPSWRPY